MVSVFREFYANATEHWDSKSILRGCLVPYYLHAINQLLGTPAVDDSIFEVWVVNMDTRRLYVLCVSWARLGKHPIHILVLVRSICRWIM